MKRLSVHLGLLISLAPAPFAFSQDRDPAAPREEPRAG